MQTYITATPFGRRPMTLGQMASQMAAKSIAPETVVEKWKVFRSIREARDLIGATDRSLAILNALLSFHPDNELSGTKQLIVWPSNEQLMARANGMSPTTLRRHLSVLVDCGLIIRRDSPNGKRYARKGRSGQVEQAYGFDLSPIVARAEEFEDLAEAVQAEKKAFKVAKERLTLLRRDIVKMIDASIEEGVPGNWGRIQEVYQNIMSKLPRTAPRQLIENLCVELEDLWVEVHERLEIYTKTHNMDANESHSGCHNHNSNTESIFESEHGLRKNRESGASSTETNNLRSLPQRDLPLGIVLNACPDLEDLAQGGEICHWRDFLAAAQVVRPMLGVSPSAWSEACEAMGEMEAAITLAAILQRSGEINSAGGYLRSLTDKARAGTFSTWPMVMALLRTKLDVDKTAVDADRSNLGRPDAGEGRLQVSDALIKSLNKTKR